MTCSIERQSMSRDRIPFLARRVLYKRDSYRGKAHKPRKAWR